MGEIAEGRSAFERGKSDSAGRTLLMPSHCAYIVQGFAASAKADSLESEGRLVSAQMIEAAQKPLERRPTSDEYVIDLGMQLVGPHRKNIVLRHWKQTTLLYE